MASTNFEGHVAVIVDSGTKVARACAALLLERKSKVLLNVNKGDHSVRHVANGLKIETSYTDPANAIQHALSEYGRVDSVLFITPTYDTSSSDTADEWLAMRGGDLDGAFKCLKAVWPTFRQQRSGRVIFMNIAEKPTMSSSASLFALLGLAQTLSLEGAKYNIAANVVTRRTPLFTIGTSDFAQLAHVIAAVPTLPELLLDSTNPDHSGAMFEISSSGLVKLRWERSRGAYLNPDKNFTPGALAPKWQEVQDFGHATFPNGPADFQLVLSQTMDLTANKLAVEPRFDGKVAIVTGAGSGLGRCYAIALARLGAKILVNDLNDPATTVEEIRSMGGEALGCQASCEDAETIVAAAVRAFGGVDILINNAGFLRDRAFINMEADIWNAVLNVHLNGTYQMTKAAWPHLAKHGNGAIVNTASTSGIYGVFGQANYSAAKLGILGLSEASAREGRGHGIRVNSIAPVAATGALAAAWANVSDKNKGLDMKPEYNVPAVLLLCSESINGQRNNITGGLFEIGCGWHAATRLRPVPDTNDTRISKTALSSTPQDWKTSSATILEHIERKKAIDIASNSYEYTHRDVILYNLSAGALRSDLSLVYERSPDFQALPIFGIIPFFSREVIMHHAELLPNFDLSKSVLGEHSLEIFQYPIPTSGRLRSTGRVLDVVDKGKTAIVKTGYTTYNADTNVKVFYNEVTFFAGAAGGFGAQKDNPEKSKQSGKKQVLPSRAADAVVQHATSPEQAALYRLNADYEALHIDPETSRRSGFDLPILHGHCTMSIAGKYIFQTFGRIRRITARFVAPVVPGDTLKIEMWKENKGVLYRVSNAETGRVCIGDSYVSLFEEDSNVARL